MKQNHSKNFCQNSFEKVLCPIHQQPVTQIEKSYEQEKNLVICEKCTSSGLTISLEVAFESFSRLKINQKQIPLKKTLNSILSSMKLKKDELHQAIELYFKQWKQEIDSIQSNIITPEVYNYYMTEQLKLQDLNHFSNIVFNNFKQNQQKELCKTKEILEGETKFSKARISQLDYLIKRLNNGFNPDYHSDKDERDQSSGSQKCDEQSENDDEQHENIAPIYKVLDTITLKEKVLRIAFTFDSKFVFISTQDQEKDNLSVYQIENKQLKLFQKILGHHNTVRYIDSSKTQNLVYTSNGDIFQVFKLENKKWMSTLQIKAPSDIHNLIVNHNDSKIYTTTLKEILLWTISENSQWSSSVLPEAHSSTIWSLAINQDSSQLASCSNEGIIMLIYRQDSYQLFQRIQVSNSQLIKFDSKGEMLGVVCKDGSVQLMKPDSVGKFILFQIIYDNNWVFDSQMQFCFQDQIIIIGAHSLNFYNQDLDNSNEWTKYLSIKMNSSRFDTSKDFKYIVANSFKDVHLLVQS